MSEREPPPESMTDDDRAWLESDLSRLGDFEPYDWGPSGPPAGKPIRYLPGVGLVFDGPRLFGYNDDNDDRSEARETNMAVPPISVRLPKETAEQVRMLAAVEHRSLAETVRLLTEEALALRAFPEITFTDGPTGRRATLIHGPDVWEVVEPYLLAGKDWTALRESYPDLDEALLRTAIRYYEAYPAEIEARIARNQGRSRFAAKHSRMIRSE